MWNISTLITYTIKVNFETCTKYASFTQQPMYLVMQAATMRIPDTFDSIYVCLFEPKICHRVGIIWPSPTSLPILWVQYNETSAYILVANEQHKLFINMQILTWSFLQCSANVKLKYYFQSTFSLFFIYNTL